MSNLTGRTFGRYQVLELLGEGGMAAVYKAYDTRLGRYVAVKVLHPTSGADSAVLRRFELEARALAQLNHPAVVRVLDYGEQDGQPYLVLEYIPSGTLKDRLAAAAGRPMEERAAAGFLVPIASALEAAHQRGIIHRDVKPGNILIAENGQPMLSDFGIAKTLESEVTAEITSAGMRMGTPDYMSPEQCSGAPVDYRTDIYSLGIVFYEMVTGRKPFSADTPMATMHRQVYDPLPDAPGLSPAAKGVLLRALAKDPAARYQTVGQFAAALNDLSTGRVAERAPAGSPPRPAPRPRPAVRRAFPWRLLLAIIAAAALLLAVGWLVMLVRPLLQNLPAIPSLPTAVVRATKPPAAGKPTAVGPVSNAWKQGRLAYISRRETTNSLYLLDPKSGDSSLLFGEPGKQAFGAAWSPDGSRLAYYIYPEDLRVQDADAPDSSRSIGRCNVPSWSADGQRIICRAANQARLLIFDAGGGGQLNQIDFAGGAVPAWNPAHAEEVAIAVFTGEKTSIWSLNIKTGEGTPLADSAAENYAPAWSPDGEQIAYQSNQGSGSSEIWVMQRDGGSPQRITTTAGGGWSRAPAWSPDGEWLAYVSSQAGSLGPDYGEIFVVSLRTGQTVQVTDTGGRVYDWRVSWAAQ